MTAAPEPATVTQNEDEQRQACASSRSAEQPPALVPGYDLEGMLGRGAYGEVWKAIDLDNETPVAIKFFTGRVDRNWQQMIREVEKLQFLANDRCVVRLRDIGRNADPPYYVMEFMENGSLEDLLRERGSLTVPEALDLGREIAEALVHAHNRGVLHCDLKPANVLLDANGQVRLSDFGQSRLAEEKAPALGTFFYMAPEQADLSAEPDARWDVYAFGAILYRIIVGKPPYSDLVTVLESLKSNELKIRLEKYRKSLRDAPKPTAHRRVEGMDAALANIMEICLRTDRNKRFANIQAVMSAFDDRQRRQARRPLVVSGIFGPIVLMAIVLIFGGFALNRITTRTKETLMTNARESAEFAANLFVERAETLVLRRFEALRDISENPTLQNMTIDMLKVLKRRPGDYALSDECKRLNAKLIELADRQTHAKARNWNVYAPDGHMLARYSHENPDFLLKNQNTRFHYRDYFHGQGRNYDPKERIDVKPIAKPYRSQVYQNANDGSWQISFSTPIRKDNELIGVLTLSLREGEFADFDFGDPNAETDGGAPEASSNQSFGMTPVLIDLKPNAKNETGSVLAHPIFDVKEATAEPRGSTSPKPSPNPNPKPEPERKGSAGAGASIPSSNTEAPRDLHLAIGHEEAVWRLDRDPWNDNHRDPYETFVNQNSAYQRYAGRWLAYYKRVNVEFPWGDVDKVAERDWVVVVEQDYDTVLGAVDQLREDVIRYGIMALIAVAAVVLGLWILVLRLLNPLNRSAFSKRFRSRLGLTTQSKTNLSSQGGGGAGSALGSGNGPASGSISASTSTSTSATGSAQASFSGPTARGDKN